MALVYLDANVLVPSYTRTLLVMGAPLSDFTVIWILHAETEAERHQEAGATPISVLRKRFGWTALVPDGQVDLADTDEKDAPILSSASLAGADLVITENIKDFGARDLKKLRMSAVHPDLFLASRLATETYRDILTRLARARTRTPNTAQEMHRVETCERLPLLAKRMGGAYPMEATPSSRGIPRLRFRGVRCVSCGELLADPTSLRVGLDSRCRPD